MQPRENLKSEPRNLPGPASKVQDPLIGAYRGYTGNGKENGNCNMI